MFLAGIQNNIVFDFKVFLKNKRSLKMKKGFISKSYALTIIFSLLLSISIASHGYAEVNPGFNRYIGVPMTPDEQAVKESQVAP
jgi:hypothetical protein